MRRSDRLPKLLTGSVLLFAGTLLANFGNYFFTFIMARLLSPANYGDMVTLFALGTILAVPTAGVVAIVSRDVARLKGTGNFQEIRDRLAGATKKFALVGVAMTVAFWLCTPLIASFLHVGTLAAALYGTTLVFTFLIALSQGTIQGLQRFGTLSLILSGQVILKIILGVAAVLVGYQLFGVMGSVVVAQAALYLLMAVYLWRKVGGSHTPHNWKTLTKENQLVIGGMLLMFLLFNLDLFFAKHFFPPGLAGSYAVLSVLGKIVLFTTGSVASVLLSLVSERIAQRQPYRHLALLGLVLVYLPGFTLVSLYAFFPSVIVGLLFPAYPQVEIYLGLYGGLSLVLAILNVLVYYFLAVRDYRFIWLLGVANVVAIGLMLQWHQSFFRLIGAALVAALLAVVGLLVLVIRKHRRWPGAV